MYDIVGEPERVHMQNVDQLHAQDYRQNVNEPQATEYHIDVRYLHVAPIIVARTICTRIKNTLKM